MKKKIIIYCSFLLLFSFIVTYSTLKNSKYSAYYENYESESIFCEEYLNYSDDSRESYDRKYPGAYSSEKCEYITKSNEKPVSFFFVYESLLDSGILKFIVPLFIPIILLYPIIYRLSLELNSGYIKYYLLRKKYSHYIFHLFKTSYKYVIPILIMFVFFIIGSAIKSNYNFNPKIDIYLRFIEDSSLIFYNNKNNYIYYFIIIILNLLFYTNVGLIVLRNNNKNYLVSFIEAFLFIYLWWCFTFIIIGKLLYKFFGIMQEQINIMEIYRWHGISDGKIFLIVNVVFYLISLIIVLLMYRNKEKLIMKCEE